MPTSPRSKSTTKKSSTTSKTKKSIAPKSSEKEKVKQTTDQPQAPSNPVSSPRSDDNEQLWSASAYVLFLIPFLGKKTDLTMYHAVQSLGYLVASIAIRIITSILSLRVFHGLISIFLLIVWIVLLMYAFRKEKHEVMNLYSFGKRILTSLKLDHYFRSE